MCVLMPPRKGLAKKCCSDSDLLRLKSSADEKHERHVYTMKPLSTQIHSLSKNEEKQLKCAGFKQTKSVIWKIFRGGVSLQVYKVVVNNGSKSWFIFRRYNEFHTLFEKVGILFYFSLFTIYTCLTVWSISWKIVYMVHL